jgi:hypothetical protein
VTTWASPADVERAASQWSDGQVNCRTYGHSWRPLTVTHRPGVYTIQQRCGRCRTERHQEVNEQGFPITGWHMRYEEGYLLRNLGRVGADGRAVLRLTTLRALTVIEEPDE